MSRGFAANSFQVFHDKLWIINIPKHRYDNNTDRYQTLKNQFAMEMKGGGGNDLCEPLHIDVSNMNTGQAMSYGEHIQ